MSYHIEKRVIYFCKCGREVACNEGSFFESWMHIDDGSNACEDDEETF